MLFAALAARRNSWYFLFLKWKAKDRNTWGTGSAKKVQNLSKQLLL